MLARLVTTAAFLAITPLTASDLPRHANRVPHDALFETPPPPAVPTDPRLWRLSPETYHALTQRLSANLPELSHPFASPPPHGFRDYAALAFIDEPATDLLLRNADLIVLQQSQEPQHPAIFAALQPGAPPSTGQIVAALRQQFDLALRRAPEPAEIDRFTALWQKNLATSGHPVGSRATLAAVLMQPEFLFRLELGTPRLSPLETATAVSLALRHTVDPKLHAAAVAGTLTEPQLASHIGRLLAAPAAENPRVIQFFREYLGYQNATGVFKDAPPHGTHHPAQLVADLEHLIAHILSGDRDVLRQLLTTDKAFVNWNGSDKPAIPDTEYPTVYGLPPDWKWTADQPLTLPPTARAGVLTHPAWLVAWSGNFDNDPVRRGHWIRTHLLGGHVREVPIGVDARVPDDEHLTLRKRLHTATSEPECWRCHRLMDPLGLPFEQFTHYGHFRNFELGHPVDTTGAIDYVADPRIAGTQITSPKAMLEALASSAHVEQVFVRHAFRFFLGRNETLGDAASLQRAWHAYRDSGGSFDALLTALLTSDAFLRRAP